MLTGDVRIGVGITAPPIHSQPPRCEARPNASSFLVIAGNWIRYGCAHRKSFGRVMFGRILIGFAQPFVLSAATHYSDLWFASRGRISAAALTNFANRLVPRSGGGSISCSLPAREDSGYDVLD
ncbi:hypothetical protein B9Z19DRAFT_1137104 [Tuber borchii]|uniref:Uncharacterized protein n=1 Tax=Tuber borchii TaxID=42251 RepID=A0A2T6ZB14_TUBBO|nr:hypothetical protein B9Z19DRAFT_1137104 [Tuber borchii]